MPAFLHTARFCLATALLVPSFGASAASFDCKRAKTTLEKFICTEPVLNAADEAMGLAYKKAAKAFPVNGFVQATQTAFLRDYRFCVDKLNPSPGLSTCLKAVSERTGQLEALLTARIFYEENSKGRYDPEEGMVLLYARQQQLYLGWFGHYMPDMKDPKPFPHGFLCEGEMAVNREGNNLKSDADTVEAVLHADSLDITEIGCGPRMGAFGGKVKEVKR